MLFGLLKNKPPVAARVEAALAGTYSRREIEAIDRLGTLVEVEAGSTLIVEGTTGVEALVIVEGSASVSQGAAIVANVGAGDLVGERALLTGAPRNATLIATTSMLVVAFTTREFTQLLDTVPSLDLAAKELVERRG